MDAGKRSMQKRPTELYNSAPAEVPRERKAASDDAAMPWSDFAVLVWSGSCRPLDVRGAR